MAKTNTKKRSWAFLVYPESMPLDTIDQLKLSGLMFSVSPLHDKDVMEDGTPKKAHYHIILVYGGPTTFNNVSKFVSRFNGTIPIPLESVRGMYRYFIHQDNPEKYQYDPHEIRSYNGFNISDFVEMTSSEVQRIRVDVIQFCRDNDLLEYSDLIEKILDLSFADDVYSNWLEVITNHPYMFTGYLNSRRNRLKKG